MIDLKSYMKTSVLAGIAFVLALPSTVLTASISATPTDRNAWKTA